MYYDFFGFREPPFSIAPDPRYLYLSERHKEALAHLMYGVQGQGGFIVITGEVGTGKTTVSRCFISNAPDYVDIALVLNPKLSARELLSSICDELGIVHPVGLSIKILIDLINKDLLAAYGAGRHKVLIIDEAQNLSAEVLEQLRLLTNLETAEKKLLQIVLLGQPELQEMLSRPSLRQLSQRITARYHLDAIHRRELPAYLRYRLSVAGQGAELFTPAAIRRLYRLSGGVPRLINLISDRALLGAYSADEHKVTGGHIRRAGGEVFGSASSEKLWPVMRYATLAVALSIVVVLALTVPDRDESSLRADIELPNTSGAVEREDAGQKDAPGASEDDAAEGQKSAATTTSVPAQPEPAWDITRDAMSLDAAFETLFSRWGVNYLPETTTTACDHAESLELRCLYRRGNWRSLERIDRPVILDLEELPGDDRFVTLVSLDGDRATIATASGEERLPIATIKRYWLGQYRLLWRVPPFLSATTQVVPKDRKALWLTARLMRLIELHAADGREREEIESMNLSDQLRWYQERKGLKVDGIAGPMTLIQMSGDLEEDRPRLFSGEGQG
ncbi:MAG: AAA family ATPase [Oleiphilaceae bacterium]|nr:AAA family ATPase [Oleiphilaceae bacterium]